MNPAQAIPRFTLYDQLLALPENQVGEIIGDQRQDTEIAVPDLANWVCEILSPSTAQNLAN